MAKHDLDALLNPEYPSQSSRYLFVERHKGSYRARIRLAGVLVPIAHGRTDRECALQVAAWFTARYGPNWPGVLNWISYQNAAKPWETRWNADDACFMLTAHLFGRPKVLFPERSFPQRTVTGIGFFSVPQAETYLRWWTREAFGMFAEYVLWRCEGLWPEEEPGTVWWKPATKARERPTRAAKRGSGVRTGGTLFGSSRSFLAA